MQYNSLPSDEIFVTSFHPKNVVFQHLEVPRVKSMKNLLNVASYKAASQFSLPPDEVSVACLNSLTALKSGIVPAFVITRRRYKMIHKQAQTNLLPKPTLLM
jgi:hypothetical protein